jgi:hypothetical protein
MSTTKRRLDYGRRPDSATATPETRRAFEGVDAGHALSGYVPDAGRVVHVYPWARQGETAIAGHVRAPGESPEPTTFERERVRQLVDDGHLSAVPLPDTPAWVRLPVRRR